MEEWRPRGRLEGTDNHGLMKMFENEGYDTGDVIVVKDQIKAKLAA